ncbi:MAG: GAF domain-containing protein [Chloroflexi bacterium]|nr:GAF domain-containing protein [Chloroflexota bacterium]
MKAQLLVVANGTERPLATIEEGLPMIVGRGADVDVRLNDLSVSRRHARLELRSSRVLLEDLNSANGTFVNSRQVPPNTQQQLDDGGVFRLGDIQLRIRIEQTPIARPQPSGRSSRSDRNPEKTNRFVVVHEAGRIINSSLILEDVFEKVLDSLIEEIGAERAFLLLVDEQGGINCRSARSLERKSIIDPERQFSRRLVDEVVRTRRPVLLDNALDDYAADPTATIVSLQLRSVMVAPMLVKDRMVGALYVDNRIQAGAFTPNELQLLESLADQAGVAIENARLHEHLQQQIREISSLKSYQDSIFRSVGSAIISLDTSGVITTINAAGERILGTSATESQGRPFRQVFGSDLSSWLSGRLDDVDDVDESVELSCRLPLRGQVWLRINVTRLRDATGRSLGAVITADDLTEIHRSEEAKRRAEQERLKIEGLFGKYVNRKVVDELIANPGKAVPGGTTRELTILFVDIRGYSTLVERMTPDQVIQLLNTWLEPVGQAIFDQDGAITQFQGDAVMAMFGAPIPQPDHALRAVKAAHQIQAATKALAAELLSSQGLQLGVGIGINSGRAIVGNLGMTELISYTAIGDDVNISARLQGQAPAGEVYLAASTCELIGGAIEVELVGHLEVKGRKQPITTYRLVRLNA